MGIAVWNVCAGLKMGETKKHLINGDVLYLLFFYLFESKTNRPFP